MTERSGFLRSLEGAAEVSGDGDVCSGDDGMASKGREVDVETGSCVAEIVETGEAGRP